MVKEDDYIFKLLINKEIKINILLWLNPKTPLILSLFYLERLLDAQLLQS